MSPDDTSARVGWASVLVVVASYVLLLIGLIVPALIDLSIQALGAPFFLPVAAIGLVLLASGTRRNTRVSRPSRLLLLFIGVLLAIAFAWAVLPSPLTDPIGGYRSYGVFAHLGAGIGWALFGISALRASSAPAYEGRDLSNMACESKAEWVWSGEVPNERAEQRGGYDGDHPDGFLHV